MLKTVYLYIADSLIEWHGDQMQGISDALNFHLIHCGFFHHSHLKQHEVNNYWALQSISLTNYPFENPACESFSDGGLLKNEKFLSKGKALLYLATGHLLLFPWLHLLTISVFFSRWWLEHIEIFDHWWQECISGTRAWWGSLFEWFKNALPTHHFWSLRVKLTTMVMMVLVYNYKKILLDNFWASFSFNKTFGFETVDEGINLALVYLISPVFPLLLVQPKQWKPLGRVLKAHVVTLLHQHLKSTVKTEIVWGVEECSGITLLFLVFKWSIMEKRISNKVYQNSYGV